MRTFWTTFRRRVSRRRRGSAVTEFAITVPLIVVLLFATVEYGNYFTELAVVTNAARDGARFGSNQETGVRARTRGAAATRILLGDVGYPCDLGDPCEVHSSIVQRGGVNMIKVTVSLPYNQVTHALPRFGVTGGGMGIPDKLVATAHYPLVGI